MKKRVLSILCVLFLVSTVAFAVLWRQEGLDGPNWPLRVNELRNILEYGR